MNYGPLLTNGPSERTPDLYENLFARIEGLFDVEAFAESRVLIAGCGSGGGQVALQLVMSGIKHFTLIDMDVLKSENVIRHVCGIRYVGRKKVDALEDILKDRNPEIAVRGFEKDLLQWNELESEVQRSHIVVLATDNDPTRYQMNELCVRNAKPFVVGKVFTRGIGGEVFGYRPGESGCLACLEGVLERTKFRDGVREIDLASEEDREKMYGLNPQEIKDSPGLAVDIGFITLFHVRYVMDALARLAPQRPAFLPAIPENYLVWGNRPIHPFSKSFELQRITLHRQDGCLVCGGGNE